MTVAFVVFTADDKQGTLYPQVVGPFEDDEAAKAFIRRHPRAELDGEVIVPIDGGYAGATVVSARSAESPADVLLEWEEWA